MKKPTNRVIVVAVVALLGVFLVVTGLGEAIIGIGYFTYLTVDYHRQERATERRIASYQDDDFRSLVQKASVLADRAEPSKSSDAMELQDRDGIPIPESLAYLKPQRVWVSRDRVTIELLHMMDRDTSLTIERGKYGNWTVTGHSGDYTAPPRLLWSEKKPAPQTPPV